MLEDVELVKIYGGASTGITATFIKYLSDAIKVVYGIGQGLGGAIRRIATKNVCSL